MKRFLGTLMCFIYMCICTACGKIKDNIPDNSKHPKEYNYKCIIDLKGIAYQPQGVSLIKDNIIYYSAWENNGMDAICEDPACEHKTDECSARIEGAAVTFVNGDKRIVIQEQTPEYAIVDDTDTNISYHSVIYECDLNGMNRKKIAELGIGVGQGNVVVIGNSIYISGVTESFQRTTPDYMIERNDKYSLVFVDIGSFSSQNLFNTEMPITLYADENAVYAKTDSLTPLNDGYTDYESYYALYQIDELTPTKFIEKTAQNIGLAVYGVDNGKLIYESGNIFLSVEEGQEGLFYYLDGKITQISQGKKLGVLLNGKMIVPVGSIEKKEYYQSQIIYDFYADKKVDTLSYSEDICIEGIYWDNIVYYHYAYGEIPDKCEYYFADTNDIKRLDKLNQVLYVEEYK